MYKESAHSRPHLHIDYGSQRHVASYAIDDGSRLAGQLDRKYDSSVSEWINKHKSELTEVWKAAQSGRSPEIILAALQGDKLG
jgi:hypothetical protein